MYTKEYYKDNSQSKDRIALKFYYRISRQYVRSGDVLDYGCGTGHLIKRFVNPPYQAFAYDISSYALETAKQNAPSAVIVNNAKELASLRFDLIISLHVLEHLDKPEEMLNLFYDLLKGNGVLIYAVPNLSGAGRRLKGDRWAGFRDKTHVSLYGARQWAAMTEEVGFTIVKMSSDGLWDVPYFKFLPTFLQKLIFYPLPAFQVLLGRLVLPAWFGESLIVVSRRTKERE
ncbi:methionine biosynthesis protein MetW [Candidatus Magnetoovum chiemensis]|nr:methionine biosynthesis protein MetW [Candidatus Magnetoovum chiemensis]